MLRSWKEDVSAKAITNYTLGENKSVSVEEFRSFPKENSLYADGGNIVCKFQLKYI